MNISYNSRNLIYSLVEDIIFVSYNQKLGPVNNRSKSQCKWHNLLTLTYERSPAAFHKPHRAKNEIRNNITIII